MRIAYLSHSTLPAPDTNTEQMIRTLVELVRQGVEVDFYLRAPSTDALSLKKNPGGPGASGPWRAWAEPKKSSPNSESRESARSEEIASFYGAPRDLFRPGGLHLIERPPARFRSESLREGAQDLFGAWAAGQKPYAALYTRDPFALLAALQFAKPVFFENYRTTYNTRRRFAPWRWLCYRSAYFAGAIAHSRYCKNSFARAHVSESKLLVAYNGYSPELLEPRLSVEEARERLAWPKDRPIVVYTGHVDPDKGLDSVLDVAALVPEALFMIVGAIPGSAEELGLRRSIEERRLENVRSLARVPPPGVPLHLYAADSLIIPPTSAPLERHGKTVLPMKTFVYLASGRPILAPRSPDLEEVLSDGQNALLVAPDQPSSTAAALRELLTRPDLRSRLGARAIEDARLYTWSARAARIREFLEDRLRA